MCNTSAKKCNTSANSVIQCKLHIEILDYDWLINNRLGSNQYQSNRLLSNQVRAHDCAIDGAIFP